MNHDTIGPQFPMPDERGWLVFDWLPDDLQNAEDARAVLDEDTAHQRWGRTFHRIATDTERELLAHIGFTNLPEELTTLVSYPAAAIRNRRWPELENGSGS
jgi:hypothetical protein